MYQVQLANLAARDITFLW